MARITILGAGYMGTALAVVAARAAHPVRLWGTWLDDELVEPPMRGLAHPRLKLQLPDSIKLFRSPELEAALDGSEAVVCAVTSDGVVPVFERATALLPKTGPLLSITKGFLPDTSGRIHRISEVVQAQFLAPAGLERPWVHIGGPCKAMEVAREVPTAAIYAAGDLGDAERCAAWLERPYYTLTRTDDLVGVETCSAFKNAYATASGLCDGLELRGHPEMYNTKAMMFSQAITETSRMVAAMGGRPETVMGISAVGDLHVTAAAGRNRTYGEQVGKGEPPAEVAERMRAAGELTEGYPALQTGWDLLLQKVEEGALERADFPLLEALHGIVYEGADVLQTLAGVRVRG